MNPRPRDLLLHPLWITSLGVLVLNDHVLKGSDLLPPLVTGKLSDVAGMFVAPVLLAVLTRTRTRGGLLLAHAAVGAGFCAIKISAAAAAMLVGALSWVGLTWKVWSDPTDILVALPAVALGAHVFSKPQHEMPSRLAVRARVALAAAGMLACGATSQARVPVEPTPFDEKLEPIAAPARVVSFEDLKGEWFEAEEKRTLTLATTRYESKSESGATESGQYVLERGQTPDTFVLRLKDRDAGGTRLPSVSMSIKVAADGQSFEDTRSKRIYRRPATKNVVAE